MGKKTIYIKESTYQKILLEESLYGELSKTIKHNLQYNKTSLGKHPSFPPDGINSFDKFITLERYKAIKERVNLIMNGEQLSQDAVKTKLSELMHSCKEMEQPLKEQLESICLNVIVELFDIPEGVIDLNCNLVDKISISKEEIRLLPEEGVVIEFKDSLEMDNVGEEIYKRRLINTLINGAAIHYANKSKLYIGDIFELNPKLPELYSQIMVLNDYLLFLINDKEVLEENISRGGYVDVVVGNCDEKIKINVEGIIFPMLLVETIKGVMEMTAVHGLPKNSDIAKYVLSQTDFALAEPWDMRLGPQLWELFINSFNESDNTKLIPYIFTEVVEFEPNIFHKLFREVFGKTKKAKTIMNMVKDKINHDLKYDDFESSLIQKQTDKTIIYEDDFLNSDEL